MKLPVLRAFAASLAYVTSQMGETVKTLWLPVLLMQGATIAIMPRYIESAMAMAAPGGGPDTAPEFEIMSEGLKWIALLYFMMAIFYPMMIAGLQRSIIRGESSNMPFSFRYGGDEFRILIGFVLVIVMTGVAYAAGVLAYLAIVLVSSALSAAAAGVVALAGLIALFVAMIWFILRLSLVFPATIDAQRVGLAASWQASKGNVWRLFFFNGIWAGLITVIAVIYMLIVMPDYFTLIGELVAAGEDQAAQQAVNLKILQQQVDIWDIANPRALLIFVATFVYSILIMAIWSVSNAIAYRYIVDDQNSGN